jgi:hypothetical protein
MSKLRKRRPLVWLDLQVGERPRSTHINGRYESIDMVDFRMHHLRLEEIRQMTQLNLRLTIFCQERKQHARLITAQGLPRSNRKYL